jgi:arylsulfatase A-like enzyme
MRASILRGVQPIPTLWLAALMLATAGCGAGDQRPRAPNVLVIVADDLGWADLGAYGSTFHETPRLDRLAGESLMLTSAYAAAPVCSPTRASLMTGLWPQRTGITDYIGAPTRPDLWTRNTRLLPAPYDDRLTHETATIAERMKASGYATFFAGKWHLGPEGWWPEDQGFDVNKGGIDRGGPYGGNRYFSPYGNPRLPDGPDGEHLPARLAAETAAFIEAHAHQPFFAFLSFYSVHTPLMARPDLEAKYEAKRAQLGLQAAWGREHERDVRLVQEHAVYAGMVDAMDEAIGVVLDRLEALGLHDDTLVVFTSDNGGLSTSEGWPTSNVPLRAGKGWLYEGGIREPMLIRWPGVTKPGSTCDEPVTSTDFYPTMLEMAGLPPKSEQHVDGESLVPLLKGTGRPQRKAIYWHYPHYSNQGGGPGGAVRAGDFKLIESYEDNRVELYNLRSDLGEQHDLAAERPEKAAELRQMLRQWRKEVGAVMPDPNPKWKP